MITHSLTPALDMADVLTALPHCYFSRDDADKRTLTDGKDAVYVELVAGMKVAGFTYEVESPLVTAISEALA
jgi:hypothetical protein